MRFATLVRVSAIALLAGFLPVVVAAPASATLPFGYVDYLESNSPGYVTVAGWAKDPDHPGTSIEVHMYVGGEGFRLQANQFRPDVEGGQPYGYSATVPVQAVGTVAVEVYGIDLDGEGNPFLIGGQTTRTVANPSPTGAIESGSSTTHRTVDIAGWASDPNAPNTPTAVGVYVGGPVGTPGVEVTRVPADRARSDGNLGFSARLGTAKTGIQPVYLYAANLPGTPGNDALIGKVDVAIYVDARPPETKINSAPTVATPQDVIAIMFSADEPGATFGCRWDSAAFETCAGTNTTSLPPGEHTFQVRATDTAGNTDPTPAAAVVVVSNYVTQPLPDADRGVKVGAVKKKSKLRINVDPDSSSTNYRVTIQRKVGKKWRKVDRVRTRGDKDVVVVNLRRGKYRVVVPKHDLGPAIKSGVVRLKR